MLSYFEHVDAAIKDYLDKLLYASLSEYMNLSEAFAYLKRIIDGVLSELLNVMSGWVFTFCEKIICRRKQAFQIMRKAYKKV